MVKNTGTPHGLNTFRALNMPEPCDVQMGKHDKPQIIKKKHGKSLSILSIKETWRVDDEWWTDHPISRQYYSILLENLSRTTIFVDRIGGGWYEQGP